MYQRMNKANVRLKLRLSWYIARGYYKQTLALRDSSEFKKAAQKCRSALQYYSIYAETKERYVD